MDADSKGTSSSGFASSAGGAGVSVFAAGAVVGAGAAAAGAGVDATSGVSALAGGASGGTVGTVVGAAAGVVAVPFAMAKGLQNTRAEAIRMYLRGFNLMPFKCKVGRAKSHAPLEYELKILIVTDAWHPQVNGVVRTYEYLRTELQNMGYQVKVIGPSDFPKSYPMPGYPEIRLVLFPYTRLRRMIEEFEPEVLHIATEGPLGFAARRYAINYGVEFTSCYHTHFPDYAAKRAARYVPFIEGTVRRSGIALMKHFHKVSSCLFVATPSLKSTLESWGVTTPMKFMTRGIDHEKFYVGDKNLFHDLPKPVALYVGRVAVEKNLESFLSMEWSGSKVIVGEGPDLQHLKNKFSDAIFVGVKTGKDLADHYRSADLFVFPSKTDTFGMVLVEAMACGLPVAAYPVTGPIDIIRQDFLGALDEDLGTAARKALLHGTAEARAAHAQDNYSWRKAAHQFLETD